MSAAGPRQGFLTSAAVASDLVSFVIKQMFVEVKSQSARPAYLRTTLFRDTFNSSWEGLRHYEGSSCTYKLSAVRIERIKISLLHVCLVPRGGGDLHL